jgi:hypothetical protein
MSKELALVELLEGLFATPERLQRFLHSLSIAGRAAPVLPEGSSPRHIAFEAVDELRRRGLIDADFFERLVEENPSEAQRIRELQSRWLVDVEEWAAIPPSEQQPSAPTHARQSLCRTLAVTLNSSKNYRPILQFCAGKGRLRFGTKAESALERSGGRQ